MINVFQDPLPATVSIKTTWSWYKFDFCQENKGKLIIWKDDLKDQNRGIYVSHQDFEFSDNLT